MTLREIIYKIHAYKLHIKDHLTGEIVTVDSTEPGSLQTVQCFLHCEVVQIEPDGNDVKVTVV